MLAGFIPAVVLVAACLTEPANSTIVRVPERSQASVEIDGKISDKEWEGARQISVAPDVTLLVFQTKDDVFMAVKAATASPAYVDMFLLLEDGKRINLHASMQVGERELPEKDWTDEKPPTHWGRQKRWKANAVKVDSGKDPSAPLIEQLAPYDGFEFRLSKERFGQRTWQLRLEVRDFAGKNPDLVYPKESDRFDADSWAKVSLEEKPE